METRPLGKTGMRITPIGIIGAAVLHLTDEEVREIESGLLSPA